MLCCAVPCSSSIRTSALRPSFRRGLASSAPSWFSNGMRVSEFQLAKAAAGDVAAKDPAVQAEKIAVLTSAKANLEELAKELKKKAKKEPEFSRDAALLTAHKESPAPRP